MVKPRPTTFLAGPGPVRALAFGPGGLLTGSGREIRIQGLATAALAPSDVDHLAFGAEGPVAIAGLEVIRYGPSLSELDRFTLPIAGRWWPAGTALSPDGRRAAVDFSGDVRIHDVVTGKQVGEARGKDPGDFYACASRIRWSEDGHHLALEVVKNSDLHGAVDHDDTWTSLVVDLESGRELLRRAGGGACAVTVGGRAVLAGAAPGIALPPASEIAWSPGGRVLAWGLEDGSVVLVDPDSGAERLRLPGTSQVHGLAWAADGRLAIGRKDGTVAVHEPA